jgi:hypothetical protein
MKAIVVSAAVLAVNGAQLRGVDLSRRLVNPVPPRHPTLPTEIAYNQEPIMISDPVKPIEIHPSPNFDPNDPSLYNDTPYFSHPRPYNPSPAEPVVADPVKPIEIHPDPKFDPNDPSLYNDTPYFSHPRPYIPLLTEPLEPVVAPEVLDDNSLYNDSPYFSHPRLPLLAEPLIPLEPVYVPEVPDSPIIIDDTPYFSHPRLPTKLEVEPVPEAAELELAVTSAEPIKKPILSFPNPNLIVKVPGGFRVPHRPIDSIPEKPIKLNAADVQLDAVKTDLIKKPLKIMPDVGFPIDPKDITFPHKDNNTGIIKKPLKILPDVGFPIDPKQIKFPPHGPIYQIPEKPIKLNAFSEAADVQLDAVKTDFIHHPIKILPDVGFPVNPKQIKLPPHGPIYSIPEKPIKLNAADIQLDVVAEPIVNF